MLRASEKVIDLIFSPGRPPQVEVGGELMAVKLPGLSLLTADDTRRIAGDLIGNNKLALSSLREQGSCDVSYSLPGQARFRANVFIQRGTCAIVMRVIPNYIPDFGSLNLPPQLGEIAHLRSGIVLLSGPTGSGKSSTLAAIVGKINEEQSYHVITIEDPIEFLHNHGRCTIHQRELHSDTPSYVLAMRAALRQAPKVIQVAEIRDRETMEVALEAAETGHLVLSTLRTVDVVKSVDRVVAMFPLAERQAILKRLAKSFRFLIAQRLLPLKNGSRRLPVVEILKSTPQTRECIEKGETGESLLEAMRNGSSEGMQHFDGEIARLVRAQVIDADTGVAYASNPVALRHELSSPNRS